MWYTKLYEPASTDPYPLSRTRIENFLKCPRCFYLQERRGVKPPSWPGWPLNTAVDELLKKEFDIYRAKGEKHPLMEKYEIDAVPVDHKELIDWRHNFTGIRYLHELTNLILFGSIDDLWLNGNNEYCVVDYKATSTTQAISLDDQYKQSYKNQIEFYQWLLRQKGYKVSSSGYFVFCNGDKDKLAFDGKLEFKLSIIEHKGNDSWVEPAILDIKKTLDGDTVPPAKPTCELCGYVEKSKRF